MKRFCYLCVIRQWFASRSIDFIANISSFRIECSQRLIIDEWFGLFEHTTEEFALFLLWFSSLASYSHLTRENLLLKAQWQKHIFVIQMFAFNMFSGCVWDVPSVVSRESGFTTHSKCALQREKNHWFITHISKR